MPYFLFTPPLHLRNFLILHKKSCKILELTYWVLDKTVFKKETTVLKRKKRFLT